MANWIDHERTLRYPWHEEAQYAKYQSGSPETVIMT